jgi:hypothetical protein
MHKTYGNGQLRSLKLRLTPRQVQRREARMWRRYLSREAEKQILEQAGQE